MANWPVNASAFQTKHRCCLLTWETLALRRSKVCALVAREHARRRPLQEMRERLAVLAVADKAEAAGRRDVARNSAHAAARAPKREVQRQVCHVNQALFGLFRERRGRGAARTEMFSATAARMSAFNAFS